MKRGIESLTSRLIIHCLYQLSYTHFDISLLTYFILLNFDFVNYKFTQNCWNERLNVQKDFPTEMWAVDCLPFELRIISP